MSSVSPENPHFEQSQLPDPAELNVIFGHYTQVAYGALRALGLQHHNAEDLAQVTVARIYKCHGDVPYPKDPGAERNPEGYVWKVAKNVAIDDYRRKQKLATLNTEAGSRYVDALYARWDETEEAALRAIDAGINPELYNALMGLHDEVRRVFVLYSQGMPYAEISKKLNIPIGTVSSRISRGREQLQEALDSAATDN